MKMLPCPFCGNVAYIEKGKHGYKAACFTIRCALLPPMPHDYFTSEEEAVKAWNTRSAPSQADGGK